MPPPPTKAWLQATGVAEDIARMESAALKALAPAMAQAQKELSADLAQWMAKLGPNAADLRYTPAHLRQLQVLLGIAQAKEASLAQYPHASFPYVAGKAVQTIMGQQMPHAKAAQTLVGQLEQLQAKFADMPSPQLVHAALLAKGDQLVLNRFKNSAARYAGQVKDDLKLQFGVGLAKGETIFQLTKRIAGLSNFQKAIDASHPTATGAAMAGALTKRYEHWAQRLARTELNSAYNFTAAAGIKLAHSLDDRIRMVWDATNDMRVCLYCKALHGKSIEPGKTFPGGHLQPPAHPNCRCALVSWMDEWADEAEPRMPASAEEVSAEQELLTKQQAEIARREAAALAHKAVAKEDLVAYDQHKIAEAQKQAAAEKAAVEAKLKAEADAYAAKLKAEAAAKEAQLIAKAAAEKAAHEKAMAAYNAKLKEEAKAKAKELAEKKKAIAALKPAEFGPESPQLKSYWKGKAKSQEQILGKGGFALQDKDTIVGHGYEFKWMAKQGEWWKTKSPSATHDYNYATKVWTPKSPPAPTTPAPAPVAPPKPVAPVLGPQPAAIKDYEWKAVDGQWVLHKGDTPTSALVPKYGLKSPMLLDTYSLGGDIAKHGLVPTGPGVMEGHGYKFIKIPSTGLWEKTMAVNEPYMAMPKAKASPHAISTPPPVTPATPVATTWTPPKVTLAANRKGVTDFDQHPSHEYAGFHGRAFTQDGDVIEGGSVRVLKVKDAAGDEYYEAVFKVTHPYGGHAQNYGSGSSENWTFRHRSLSSGVMHDDGREERQAVKTRIHKGDTHTVEVGAQGAVTNMVRIRAKSLAGMNAAMDDFGRHLGADLRKPPNKEDLELQAKARLASKFDPAGFGKAMSMAHTPEAQRAAIEDRFKAVAQAHPVAAKALADAKEVEVYPGHKTLYSKTLGQEMKKTWGAMYHDSGAESSVAAQIVGQSGLMSSVKRFNSGVFTTGMSTSSDFGTGGADGVFLRVAKHAPSTTGSKVRYVIDTEKVMGRLDWWAFNHDNFGRAGYGNYSERWSIPDQKTGSAQSGNEVMVTHGVPREAIKKVICSNPYYRDQVLDNLRRQGVTVVNGVPIEEFVVMK